MGDQSSHMSPQPQPEQNFAGQSSLTYFVPRATDFAPDQVFKDESLSFQKLLESIERRESLFFGEPARGPYLVVSLLGS
jgi:hypothetical protein